MNLKIKAWLYDIYRSIKEIEGFIGGKMEFSNFSKVLKPINYLGISPRGMIRKFLLNFDLEGRGIKPSGGIKSVERNLEIG